MSERAPQETPARIAPLPSLPLFHHLRGRKAVVVGASEGADWKAELLAAAGAKVVRLRDGWTAEDLSGTAIAVADLANSGDIRGFADAARKAGAVVNVIDRPEFSDVQFGTIVNRRPVVIGISTDGAAPMLGQSVRARIESVLPLGLSRWAEAAKTWRPRLKKRVKDFGERRRFWEAFVEAAWREPGQMPGEDDFERLLIRERRPKGCVSLVGAGPGDPGLLTLKAIRALQSATVILYDHLVGPEVLELARREAKRIAVGKRSHGPSCKQQDINEQMVELALAGETVVRLKGGDPLIFGRATEEIAVCEAAGIEVTIVPGISAVQGAAASLLFSLTERTKARRVQYVTGRGADGKLPRDIDWKAIADPTATTVLYMPKRTLAEFVRKALAAGLNARTPAVAIACATLPDEQHVAGPIGELPALAVSLPAGAPAIVIIGWVARRIARSSAAILPFARTGS
jgi:uroporphyrin-III C-methyltransferase/precorrin-2 dehydrogenase/sirohydrochlorin ferrochelatase